MEVNFSYKGGFWTWDGKVSLSVERRGVPAWRILSHSEKVEEALNNSMLIHRDDIWVRREMI